MPNCVTMMMLSSLWLDPGVMKDWKKERNTRKGRTGERKVDMQLQSTFHLLMMVSWQRCSGRWLTLRQHQTWCWRLWKMEEGGWRVSYPDQTQLLQIPVSKKTTKETMCRQNIIKHQKEFHDGQPANMKLILSNHLRTPFPAKLQNQFTYLVPKMRISQNWDNHLRLKPELKLWEETLET